MKIAALPLLIPVLFTSAVMAQPEPVDSADNPMDPFIEYQPLDPEDPYFRYTNLSSFMAGQFDGGCVGNPSPTAPEIRNRPPCYEIDVPGVSNESLAALVTDFQAFLEQDPFVKWDAFCNASNRSVQISMGIDGLSAMMLAMQEQIELDAVAYFEQQAEALLGQEGMLNLLEWEGRTFGEADGTTSTVDLPGFLASQGMDSAQVMATLCMNFQ